MKRFYGIDGCGGGWVVAESRSGLRPIRFSLAEDLAPLFSNAGPECLIAIDIPIGLPIKEPRSCDREARRLLGPRRSSVFSPSARQTLEARTFRQALRINQKVMHTGLSIQAFHISPKIRDVDVLMNAGRQRYVREVHPEVTFARLNGSPMLHYKKTAAGRAERIRVLNSAGLVVSEQWLRQQRFRLNRAQVAMDDLLDSLACLITAVHIGAARYQVLGHPAQCDEKQLRMEIVTCDTSEKAGC